MGNETDGWIDTGNDLPGWDQHVYLSAAGARNVAKFLGWHSPDALDGLKDQVAALEALVEQLQAELADQDAVLEGIDGLTRKGYVVRKAPGRKPKPKPEEEAVA